MQFYSVALRYHGFRYFAFAVLSRALRFLCRSAHGLSAQNFAFATLFFATQGTAFAEQFK